MKKILITGAGSYVGTSVERYLNSFKGLYQVDTLDMKKSDWQSSDFSQYDVVFHVAGIAHVSKDKKLDDLYFKVNRDLAIEAAEKAKNAKVKQFVFMSSGIIYGIDEPVGKRVVINGSTKPKPQNAYGKSKLQADLYIQGLNSDEFHTLCLRTPMVYGKNCKGNFQLLKKYANKLFILPKITNYRSMIHIENLASCVKYCIDHNCSGVFYPSNREYVSTNSIVSTIRELNGKKTYYSRALGFLVKMLSKRIALIRKIYGDLAYSEKLLTDEYIINDFVASIEKSV